MSTVKTDNVVGSFTPLPVMKQANDVEVYAASAGQTVFTTTKFTRASAIKVFAKNGDGTFTPVTASWTGENTVTISGISLTAGQQVYIYSIGVTASQTVVQRADGSYTTADVYLTELETRLNAMPAAMHATALLF